MTEFYYVQNQIYFLCTDFTFSSFIDPAMYTHMHRYFTFISWQLWLGLQLTWAWSSCRCVLNWFFFFFVFLICTQWWNCWVIDFWSIQFPIMSVLIYIPINFVLNSPLISSSSAYFCYFNNSCSNLGEMTSSW